MLRILINRIVSYLWYYEAPNKHNSFFVQKKTLNRLLRISNSSPLYESIWLKQDKRNNILFYNEIELKRYLSTFPLINYKDHILNLVASKKGIVKSKYDLLIKTSGTSDANNWWKLIPSNWSSFSNESIWIKRTLSFYLKYNKNSKLLFNRSFSLTAPFDCLSRVGYVSWAIRYYNFLYKYISFPSTKIINIVDWNEKKEKIINMLLSLNILIGSFHWVPTWFLDIIYSLWIHSKTKTKKILKQCEYISIGWWPALDYKNIFQKYIFDLWLKQKIYASNNHNSSEWFLWSQIRFFDDLDYHWMSPVIQTNFYLFIPVNLFSEYESWKLSYNNLLLKSHLLHEVIEEKEYLMIFANERIPRLYNIKDKVVFKNNSDWFLEYVVTWRYGMSSNIFNEHLELEHILYSIDDLITCWYNIDKYNFVAWMQLIDNCWIFHIIIEWNNFTETVIQDMKQIIDNSLWWVNDQWKIFRWRKKIIDINLVIVQKYFIRNTLISLKKMHEQSKIPHLSDMNYEFIIKPLLSEIKKSV